MKKVVMIITIVVALILGVLLVSHFDWWSQATIIAVVFLSTSLGLAIPLALLALVSPLYVPFLVNKPEGDKKSGFHIFTYPEEGKVKLIVRGDDLVRMVMLYAGHRFKRAKTAADPEHWKIIKTKVGEKAEDPLEGINFLIKPWARYVFNTTGAVFTGIYPFQTVREYPLERTKMIRNEEGISSENAGETQKNIKLAVEHDVSDHLRTREFLYPFRVVSADTKDKIPVEILGVIKAKTVNPHRAAFGTDRWDHQLVNLVTDAMQRFARTKTLDEVLTASDPASADAINKVVEGIVGEELKYGIQITGVDIIDTSAIVSKEDRSKIQAEALARQVGKATVIDGESRATALRKLNEANATGGEHALETLRTEAFVRAAGAAKEGTIIIGSGNQTDPTQAAILAELREMNKQRKNP